VDTLTHARVRAAQGDVAGARRILTAMLARDPEDPGARRLLGELEGRTDAAGQVDADETLAPPEPCAADELAPRFRSLLGAKRRAAGSTGARPAAERRTARARILRLEHWLARVERAGRAAARCGLLGREPR